MAEEHWRFGIHRVDAVDTMDCLEIAPYATHPDSLNSASLEFFLFRHGCILHRLFQPFAVRRERGLRSIGGLECTEWTQWTV